MAYKSISTCGGLRYSTSDFTEVDKVITEASMPVDVYEPTYSAGVTADFDDSKYADTYGKNDTTFTLIGLEIDIYTPTYSSGLSASFDASKYANHYSKTSTTFTASVSDLVTEWSDGTSTLGKDEMADSGFTGITGVVNGSTITISYTTGTDTKWSDGSSALTIENMAEIGLSNISGAVEGSTIKIEYSEESVPRTELVGESFVASMCGGIKFDDGVFAEVGNVITTYGTTSVASSFRANCGLLFDASKFELGDDKEICLI